VTIHGPQCTVAKPGCRGDRGAAVEEFTDERHSWIPVDRRFGGRARDGSGLPPMRKPPALPRTPFASALVGSEPAAASRSRPHVFGAVSAKQRPPWLVDGDELFKQAVMHAREGRLDEAVRLFDELIRLKPDHADALNDRGNALDLLRRRDEALESYERALRVRPGHIHALCGRANILQAFGRQEEALRAYDEVIAIDARYLHAWNGRGNALMALNRHREALESFLRAQAIDPAHPASNFNEGLARLSLGEFEIGWRRHEARWALPSWLQRRREFEAPLWLGQSDPRGKVLLLHAEQGFGDTLQFCRYVPLVAATGARVVLEVQPALGELLCQLPGVETLLTRGEPIPRFDLHCPLLSLPLAMSGTLGTIPPPPPALHADADRLAQWGERLGARECPRIGIAWQGNAGHDNDYNRSIRLERLRPLLDLEFEFVSLQQRVPPRDAAALAECPHVRQFDDELRDFSETAALIAHLDLVVAVDTSVAHVAATMGKPVWVLLPWVADWRWLIDRGDSPWYPSVRLFRQPHAGAWDEVVDRVRLALSGLDLSRRS
jgi:tetratricopeptide (TPR) repeat protein